MNIEGGTYHFNKEVADDVVGVESVITAGGTHHTDGEVAVGNAVGVESVNSGLYSPC